MCILMFVEYGGNCLGGLKKVISNHTLHVLISEDSSVSKTYSAGLSLDPLGFPTSSSSERNSGDFELIDYSST